MSEAYSASLSLDTTLTLSPQEKRLYVTALWLSIITIGYNILEGVVSTWFGVQDETITLFGFGADSFIEVISGIGIAHYIYRMRRNPYSQRDHFEIQALRITGTAFYLLVAVLAAMIILNLLGNEQPQTTLSGIIISLVSLLSMWLLIRAKLKVGHALQSAPILADANCTKVCLMMSAVLLAASLLYELSHIAYIDSLGAAGIMYYSLREGRECFAKARNKGQCACTECH